MVTLTKVSQDKVRLWVEAYRNQSKFNVDIRLKN